MGAGSKASQRRLTARERERKAMELRLAGATYAQIAQALGISQAGAHKAVMRALKRLNEKLNEQAEQVRRLELERLDRMLLALWPQAQKGNHGAVDRILRIMERRARLLGLDAPKSVDVTSGGEPLQIILDWGDGNADGDDAKAPSGPA